MGRISEKITVLKEGKELECDVLFSFDCEENGKRYLGYTDNSYSNNGRKNIYISSYDPVAGSGVLNSLTDDNELSLVQEILTKIDEESRM